MEKVLFFAFIDGFIPDRKQGISYKTKVFHLLI